MYPSEIKIGSRIVKVRFEDLSEANLLGYFDQMEQEIVLNSQITNADILAETFWHELVHAINDFIRFEVELQREMNNADDSDESAFNFNEVFTERFSVTLVQVIKDNNLKGLIGDIYSGLIL